MEVLQDISKWSRDQKVAMLNSIIEEDEEARDPYPMLKVLMTDPDAEVRRLAVTALWDYPHTEIIDPLFDLARNDPSEAVRAKAVSTLGRFIYEGDMADYDFDWGEMDAAIPATQLSRAEFLRVKDFLVDLATDASQSLESRGVAVEALSFLDASEVDDLIEQAYAHPETTMKASALFAMGRSGNRRWSKYILKELDSEVPELRMEAARAAGEAYLEEAGSQLLKLAESDDRDLRLEAIWALGKTGGANVPEFLRNCVKSRDPDVREVAMAALEELETMEMDVEDDE